MKFTNEIVQLFRFINWIKPDVKSFLPGLIGILIINGIMALTGVGLAIASKNMIDYATAGKLNYAVIAGVIFGGIIDRKSVV